MNGSVSAQRQPGAAVDVVSARLRFVIAWRALEAIRKRIVAGEQVAGVAFGRIGWGSDARTTVEVLGIETLAYGSDSRWGIRRRARRIGHICERARRRGLLPVGWVRSAGAGAAALNEADLALAERFFSEPYETFILLRRAVAETVEGTLFARDADGTLRPEGPLQRFEIGPAEAAGPEWEAGTPRRRRSVMWAAGIASVLFGAAIGYRLTTPPVGPAPERPRLTAVPSRTAGAALAVDVDGADIRASWNRGAPLFQGAKSAVMTVRDGAEEKEIPLNLDLPGGVVVYTPKTGDVEVRIRAEGSEEHSEIVRVVAAEPGSPGAERTALVSRAVEEPTPPKAPLRRFVPPAAARSAPEQQGVTPLPGPGAIVAAQQMPAGLAIPGGVSIPAPPPPKQPAPVPQAGAAPAADPPSPPVPIRKVFPNLPANSLPGKGTVVVLVGVNSRGVVNSARVTGGTESNRLVQSMVITAARQWLFQPARVHGRAVDGQTEITFQLSPSQ